jgi:S-DNA-T family DNA segregation ATPase FtsK/SpoIIIE
MARKKSDHEKEQAPMARRAHQSRLDEMRVTTWYEWLFDFTVRFKRFGEDIAGLALIILALLTLLAILGNPETSGAWISSWSYFLSKWLGWGSIFVVFSFGTAGLLLMNKQRDRFTLKDWRRVIWLEVFIFSMLALFSVIGGASLERAEAGKDGGLIGWGLAEFVGLLFGAVPEALAGSLRAILLAFLAVLGFLFGFGLFGKVIQRLEVLLEGGSGRDILGELDHQPAVVVDGKLNQDLTLTEPNEQRKRATRLPAEFRKDFKLPDRQEEKLIDPPRRDDTLPPLDILLAGEKIRPSERHINQTAGLIEKTLSDFGIPAKVTGFKVGPTITQFAVEPGYLEKSAGPEDENRQKVRVSQIAGLRRDLALALSAQQLRIQAPVPGRAYIGIEVPNKKSITVRLKSILETEAFYRINSPLALALGRDVSGQPVVADLTRMPHILIAGTTGSGKSVSIAAMTACLAMNNSPEDLRMVMIDPKMVELVRFNGLPHMIGKVETDLERIAAVLRWILVEMERRYKLLEELKARDIESYNRKVLRRKDAEMLPRIVVMIDELADLMMSAAEQTETTVVRLAQMARATGIHLVIATQRPSTDVVTGLIKANFPARISFAVASGVDSRVILDSAGAETLLGKGDLLFVNPEEGVPIRAQGVFVSDKEIENLITYWQKAWEGEGDHSPWDDLMLTEAVLADRDDLVEQAIEILRQSGRASTSMMQRRLKVGYPRAARLMDELEDLGIVGPSQGGGKERDILIDLNDREGL